MQRELILFADIQALRPHLPGTSRDLGRGVTVQWDTIYWKRAKLWCRVPHASKTLRHPPSCVSFAFFSLMNYGS